MTEYENCACGGRRPKGSTPLPELRRSEHSVPAETFRCSTCNALCLHSVEPPVSATQLTGAGEPSKVPPPSGMALSMLDVPTRVEATVRDLRDFACGLDVPEERELVQHAADMLEIAARSTTGRGHEWMAKNVNDFTSHFLQRYEATGSLRESMMWAYAATYQGVPPGPESTVSATGTSP